MISTNVEVNFFKCLVQKYGYRLNNDFKLHIDARNWVLYTIDVAGLAEHELVVWCIYNTNAAGGWLRSGYE